MILAPNAAFTAIGRKGDGSRFCNSKKIPSKCPVMQSKYEPELDDRIDKTLVMDSVKKLVTGFMFVQRTVEYLYRLQA